MPKLDLLEEPKLDVTVAYGWQTEAARLLRALTILTVVFINKIKEEKK